jgi:hypothetical protein
MQSDEQYLTSIGSRSSLLIESEKDGGLGG